VATKIRKTKAAVEFSVSEAPLPDEVALRAYEIYETGEGGDALAHWLRAERELASETVAA
jgi:Protein of unknown function (DUF2934)